MIFSKLGSDGTLRSGSKCLASKNGVLILDSCSFAVDGESASAIQWTTTDSMTGSYIEQGSKAPIRIELSQCSGHGDTLDIEFVPGMQHRYHSSQVAGRTMPPLLLPHAVTYWLGTDCQHVWCLGTAWKTAHCALSADAHECTGGHFEGGTVGALYPDCYWNASVTMPTVETAAISSGCKGCCLHTTWTKTGYLPLAGLQETAQTGNCAAICGGTPPPAPQNDTAAITSQMLFPVRICNRHLVRPLACALEN